MAEIRLPLSTSTQLMGKDSKQLGAPAQSAMDRKRTANTCQKDPTDCTSAGNNLIHPSRSLHSMIQILEYLPLKQKVQSLGSYRDSRQSPYITAADLKPESDTELMRSPPPVSVWWPPSSQTCAQQGVLCTVQDGTEANLRVADASI